MLDRRSWPGTDRAGSFALPAEARGFAVGGDDPDARAARAGHDETRHTATPDCLSDPAPRAREDFASPPAALLDRMCRLATEVLGCDCSHTVLLRPAQDRCVVVAARGDDTSHEQWTSLTGLTVPGTVVAELLDCLQHGALLQGPTWCLPEDVIPLPERFGVTWSLYMPLRWNHELVGYQHAGYVSRTTPLSASDERDARALANLSAAGLATLRLVGTLEDANRFKERFLGNLTHELHGGMLAILGYGDLLVAGEYGPLTHEESEIVQRMQTSSMSLLDLFTTTLDLSRLEQSAIPLDLEAIRVGELTDEVAAETRALAKPHVDVVWHVPPDLPTVRTDRVKLKIVLRNLVANALKFTEQGSVTVRVRPRPGGVEFAVADTGPGITPAAQAVIFEPFSQGDRTGARRDGGVGLGLCLARRIVERFGGTMTVESEIGLGSCFRVLFPLDAGLEIAHPQPSATGAAVDGRIHHAAAEKAAVGVEARDGRDAACAWAPAGRLYATARRRLPR
jgi:signal transduction histidine kinase